MSDPNRSSVIPDVDITLVQPDNLFPIHLPPFLMILGPLLLSILVGFCEIHNFACFSSMKPCFMQGVRTELAEMFGVTSLLI
jgi:hypothetical protein